MIRALWIAALVLAAACTKSSSEPPDWTAPPPMEQAEQQRGVVACDTYVARLCRCAETDPDLAQQCRLARSQPEALDRLLGMVNGKEGKLGKRELREAQHTARKIVQDCFEKDAALDPHACPR